MKTITVSLSRPYDVVIGQGLLAKLGEFLSPSDGSAAFVVTDENVAPLYLGTAVKSLRASGFSTGSLSVPAGEASKSLDYYVNLLDMFAMKGLSRTDRIIALGGGVVGDLAGFAAATYLRGLPFVQVPTSLLAMVDASVGGKNGINRPGGKNQAGTIRQPSCVLCDPALLDTLPKEEFLSGCGEIIKTAVLFDPELFGILEKQGPDFDREEVISRCIRWKRDMVLEDEEDRGPRHLLNLGHTVGHALEKLSDYLIPHGFAVSMGLAVFARAFSEDSDRIIRCLQKFGLPTEQPFPASLLVKAALSDKKRQGDSITLAVPHKIGSCTLESVPVNELEKIIEAGL